LEQRADQRLQPKSKSVSTLIDDYTRYRQRDHRHYKTSDGTLRQIIRVSKFSREYAGPSSRSKERRRPCSAAQPPPK
jgi:hypothetical protein